MPMKRLLFLAHRVPYPPDKGERVRAFHEILALAGRFRVTVACLAHRPEDVAAAAQLRRYDADVLVAPAGGMMGRARAAASLLAGRSATQGFFRSPRLDRLVARAAAGAPFDVVLAYCSSMLPHAMVVPAPVRVLDLVEGADAFALVGRIRHAMRHEEQSLHRHVTSSDTNSWEYSIVDA
jgi:polysaccharide biosynthesis protein PslH